MTLDRLVPQGTRVESEKSPAKGAVLLSVETLRLWAAFRFQWPATVTDGQSLRFLLDGWKHSRKG